MYRCPQCGYVNAGKGIGNKVKKYRAAKNLSQEALAYKLGVTRITVARWESGTVPYGAMLTKLEKKGVI